jgi:DNA-binding LacI/PurR family transcriptional regulator
MTMTVHRNRSESTVRAVAARAGVSPTTAWRVMRRRGHVMPALTARVVRALGGAAPAL